MQSSISKSWPGRRSRVLVGLALAGYVLPGVAAWNGSYEVQGECYCTGVLPDDLRSAKRSTPVGMQSVAQICAQIGEGPALVEEDGIFNYPVYADPQCGHGPHASVNQPIDPTCVGTLDSSNTLCLPAGPRWNLARAYADEVMEKASATAAVESELTEPAEPDDGSVAAASETDSESELTSVLKPTYVQSAPSGGQEQPPTTTVETAQAASAAGATTLRPRYIDPATLRASSDDQTDPSNESTRVAPAPTRVAPAQRGDIVVDESQGSLQERLDATRRQQAQRRMESPEALRERQIRLLAEARERLRLRELAEESTQASADGSPAASEPVVDQIAEAPLEASVEAPVTASVEVSTETPTEPVTETPTEIADATDAGDGTQPEEPELASATAETTQDQDTRVIRESVDAAAADVEDPVDARATASSGVSALRLPAATRASSREFQYVDAMPIGYDYGAGGIQVEGSRSSHGRIHYLARIGLASEYREVLIGAGYHFTPPAADRVTLLVTAGLEYGQFDLEAEDISTDYSDSGLYLGASTRFVVNNRFELQGGLGYSSFFEGDATVFGAGLYHLSRQLDVTSRFELGDNDSLGFGIRYYY